MLTETLKKMQKLEFELKKHVFTCPLLKGSDMTKFGEAPISVQLEKEAREKKQQYQKRNPQVWNDQDNPEAMMQFLEENMQSDEFTMKTVQSMKETYDKEK